MNAIPFSITTEVVTDEYVKIVWRTPSGIMLEFRIPKEYDQNEVMAFLTDIDLIFRAGMDSFFSMSEESLS